MPREIKFRAVLNKEARSRTGEYTTRVREFTLNDLMRGQVVFSFPEHWTFHQFTGLKDKTSKEIYESDVLEYNSFENGKERYLVEFIAAGFKFVGQNVKGWIEPEKDINNCEIIGNPELLTN